jgi:uncharacterized GH25 family protein
MVLLMEIAVVYGDTDGLAIIAVRTTAVQLPWGLGPAGHVGVGFQNEDGTWTIGAIENSGGSPIVLSQKGLMASSDPGTLSDNDAWVESHLDLEEVEAKFRSLGYDGIKTIQVSDSNPDNANKVINDLPKRGYNVATYNCLSATIDVLNAYGAKNLPLQIAHVAPNDYYANVEGEEYLWDSGKGAYTDLFTGMPLADNPSRSREEPSSMPATAAIQQPVSQEEVTLTLYIHNGDASGPIIPGAQVTGRDGSGNSFQQTADGNGFVTIKGDPGTWSFSASAEGYETIGSSTPITEAEILHMFLVESTTEESEESQGRAVLTIYVHEGDLNGILLSGVEVTGKDAKGNSFEGVTDSNGIVDISGQPGTWQYTFSKEGYDTLTSNFDVDKTGNRAVYLENLADSQLEPIVTAAESSGNQGTDQPAQVTLTLYVHDGSADGPVIPGVQVTGQDGSGNSFQQTTDSNGYVTIKGDSGTWSFSASAEGYEINNWDQVITGTDTKHAFLQEEQQQDPWVTLTLYINDGSISGPIISGAQVTGQDGLGNSFEGATDDNGIMTIPGAPGTWSFSASAEGYNARNWEWSEPITDTCARHMFLVKSSTGESAESQVQVVQTIYVHDGDLNGTLLSDVEVTGQDAKGNSFEGVTDSDGVVDISGQPGIWQFRFAKEGYDTLSLNYDVAETGDGAVYLKNLADSQLEPIATTAESSGNQGTNQPAQVTLTLYVRDGSADGPIIPGAQVKGQDGSGNRFYQTTDLSGYVTIAGDPGTWSFTASANGYETNSWDQEITETDTKHAFLFSPAEEYTNSPESAENSVAGKWKVRVEYKLTSISCTDPCPISSSVYSTYAITFYKDGTFAESNREIGVVERGWEELEEIRGQNPPEGEWIQNGNTVRLQYDNTEDFIETAINGDMMTWTSSYDRQDDSYGGCSIHIQLFGSAEKVGTEE